MKSFIRLLMTTPLLLVASAVLAQTQPITVNTVAEKEERYTDPQGIERSRLVPVATVIPGDQVVYTITFANRGTQTAEGIKIVDPIPDEMRYVADSANGPGTIISFSADGGQTFGAVGTVMVSDDGSRRAATPNEFTHIQWVFNHPLEPGAQAHAQFKAVLQ